MFIYLKTTMLRYVTYDSRYLLDQLRPQSEDSGKMSARAPFLEPFERSGLLLSLSKQS